MVKMLKQAGPKIDTNGNMEKPLIALNGKIGNVAKWLSR